MSKENPTMEELQRMREESQERMFDYFIFARRPSDKFFQRVKYTPDETREWYHQGISRQAAEDAQKMLQARGFEAYIVQAPGSTNLDEIVFSEAIKKYASENGIPLPGENSPKL